MFKEKENYQQQQRAKAWESTVRKAQQQNQRRRFFSPMSVAPADDDSDTTTPAPACGDSDDPSSSPSAQTDDVDDEADVTEEEDEVFNAERLLPSGDYYTGQWSGGVPHGTGKYLWTDGCMYEGEWRRGKTTGRGKFSWPSGATYQGEFKAGFMDGFGTYTGASGDTYFGMWSMNLKHGQGKKSYANGDHYDGEWRSGLQDGQGRYVWRNGTEYVGQWRAGLIHGRGSLIWANGNRYDGGWDNGYPRGNGNFRWADGALYVGVWTNENAGIQQKGVYYPSPAATSPTARDPQDAFAADLKECKISPGETVTILPSQKTLNWSGIEVWQSSNATENSNGKNPRRRASEGTPGAGLPPRRPNGRMHTVTGINEDAGADKGFDRICIWQSDGDITCDIVDGRSPAVTAGGRDGMEDLRGDLRVKEAETKAVPNGPKVRWQPPRTLKKQGETICKGHKNYDLMLNLQLGIR